MSHTRAGLLVAAALLALTSLGSLFVTTAPVVTIPPLAIALMLCVLAGISPRS